jgi:hypothetical protein
MQTVTASPTSDAAKAAADPTLVHGGSRPLPFITASLPIDEQFARAIALTCGTPLSEAREFAASVLGQRDAPPRRHLRVVR